MCDMNKLGHSVRLLTFVKTGRVAVAIETNQEHRSII